MSSTDEFEPKWEGYVFVCVCECNVQAFMSKERTEESELGEDGNDETLVFPTKK